MDADKLADAGSYFDDRLATLEAGPVSVGLAFRSNGDGTCTLTGKGEWTGSELNIPAKSPSGEIVTEIAAQAFDRNSSITKVVIPEGITTIGKQAFNQCTYLTEIVYKAVAANDLSKDNQVFKYAGYYSGSIKLIIGKNVTKIPAYMFSPVSSIGYGGHPTITAIEFEDGGICESIGDYAFHGCKYLVSLPIPDTIKSIGEYAFFNAIALPSLYLPKSISRLGDYAFAQAHALQHLYYDIEALPDYSYNPNVFKECGKSIANSEQPCYTTFGRNVRTIPGYLFISSTKYVEFEEGSICERIGPYAFKQSDLVSIILPESLITICQYAFNKCSKLLEVTFGSNLTSIETYAFNTCENLATMIFNGTMAQWGAISKGYVWSYKIPSSTYVQCIDGMAAK
jgi:hypothetical protein